MEGSKEKDAVRPGALVALSERVAVFRIGDIEVGLPLSRIDFEATGHPAGNRYSVTIPADLAREVGL